MTARALTGIGAAELVSRQGGDIGIAGACRNAFGWISRIFGANRWVNGG